MAKSQRKHIRRSVKGKKFLAGRGKKKPKARKKVAKEIDCPRGMQMQILQENYEDMATTLKKKGRVRIPELGILRIHVKKATKARTIDNPFKPGEKMKIKAKPKRRLVKFRAAKPLMRRL